VKRTAFSVDFVLGKVNTVFLRSAKRWGSALDFCCDTPVPWLGAVQLKGNVPGVTLP
jgi:hypothetical protein